HMLIHRCLPASQLVESPPTLQLRQRALCSPAGEVRRARHAISIPELSCMGSSLNGRGSWAAQRLQNALKWPLIPARARASLAATGVCLCCAPVGAWAWVGVEGICPSTTPPGANGWGGNCLSPAMVQRARPMRNAMLGSDHPRSQGKTANGYTV